MRELVFELTYDPGSNAVGDALAEHPDATVRSQSLYATEESLWRVDHANGPPDALEDIEAAFLDSDYYIDCLTPRYCGAPQRTRVFESTDKMLVLYSYWERTDSCASVPHIALEQLGHGVLFEATREQRRNTWRIIHSGDGDVRAFFDELEENVGEAVEIDFQRLAETDSPNETSTESGGLTPEQKEALQAAVEHGYYESPGEIDVKGLSDVLDVPRSTLNHRLRRAEEHMAKQRVAQMRSNRRSFTFD